MSGVFTTSLMVIMFLTFLDVIETHLVLWGLRKGCEYRCSLSRMTHSTPKYPLYLFHLLSILKYSSHLECDGGCALGSFSDPETETLSPSLCHTLAPHAHKVLPLLHGFKPRTVTSWGMTRAAKSAQSTWCVSDYLQYLCVHFTLFALRLTKLALLLRWEGRVLGIVEDHDQMDVCDFNRDSGGAPESSCLVFSLMAGDLLFTSLIVVLDLLLERKQQQSDPPDLSK